MAHGEDNDAYGRVTSPERYRPLHEAAKSILDDLVRRYDVERIEESGNNDFTVRLVPATPTSAALVMQLTAFPGVFLRLGHWHTEAYPRCGCDACDEQPEDLIAELHRDVEAVVSGHFREERRKPSFLRRLLRRPQLYVEISQLDGSRGGWGWLARDDPRRGPRERHDWAPWPALER